jgi:hypothetical protein
LTFKGGLFKKCYLVFLEMRLLRETSKAQMAAELEAIKVMRETAMANIAEAQAQAAKVTQVCTNIHVFFY